MDLEDAPLDKIALICEDLQVTYREFNALVNKTKASLYLKGIRKGDRVCLVLKNSVEFCILFFAICRMGCVACPLNPKCSAKELEFYFRDILPALVLGSHTIQDVDKNWEDHALYQSVKATRINLACPVPVYENKKISLLCFNEYASLKLSNLSDGYLNTSSINVLDTDNSIPLPLSNVIINKAIQDLESIKIDLSTPSLILHTSGTTGRPKVVMHTQYRLERAASNIIHAYKLTQSDSTILLMTLFHVHGLITSLLGTLLSGGTLVLGRKKGFSVSTFLSDAQLAHITWLSAVPTIHQLIYEHHTTSHDSYADVSQEVVAKTFENLRFVRSCSAALPAVLQTRLEAFYKVRVLEAYAMTEACHMMTTNTTQDQKLGSVGKPVNLDRLTIRNDSGDILNALEVGEVCVCGETIIKEYLARAVSNENKDGAKEEEEEEEEARMRIINRDAYFDLVHFRTGDLGYLDEQGFLFLTGRKKELINCGGEKISPVELDHVLLSHPDVNEAVSFGIPSLLYGEAVACLLVMKESVPISLRDSKAKEIQDHVKASLAPFKVPTSIKFLESIPKTATGKTQRLFLAQNFINL